MSVKASEIKLINRIATGEESALAQLFQSNSEVVYRYLKRLTGDSDRSDRFLVKTFQQAWQSASDYDQKLAPDSWLLQLARNAVLSGGELNLASKSLEDAEATDNIVALDRQKVFVRAMDSMPLELRDSLVMVLMQVFTYHAIAEIMEQSIDEVKAAVKDWQSFAKKANLSKPFTDLIAEKHRDI